MLCRSPGAGAVLWTAGWCEAPAELLPATPRRFALAASWSAEADGRHCTCGRPPSASASPPPRPSFPRLTAPHCPPRFATDVRVESTKRVGNIPPSTPAQIWTQKRMSFDDVSHTHSQIMIWLFGGLRLKRRETDGELGCRLGAFISTGGASLSYQSPPKPSTSAW